MTDPTGGEAATAAVESATTGAKKAQTSITNARNVLARIGDDGLEIVSTVATEAAYRVGRQTEANSLTFISKSLNIRELVAWLEGWEAKINDELPQPPA